MDSNQLFNQTLESFIKDLLEVFPDFKDEINKLDIKKYKSANYYNFAHKNNNDISLKNEIIFSKELGFMEPIPFYKLWTQDISSKSRDNLWKYIQNLYLYSYCDVKGENVLDILLLSKKADINWSELDEEKTKIVAMFYKIKEGDINLDDETKKNEGIDAQFLPKIGNVDLFDTKIGALAKEISEDINMDDIDPEKLLSGLQGGKMDIEGSGLMGLISSIGDKVKNKMENNDMDSDNLVNEANNIMGEFNKMGGDNPLNMLNNLFKGSGGMPDLSKMNLNNMDLDRELTSKEKRNAKKKAKKKEKNSKKADKILEKALDELNKK